MMHFAMIGVAIATAFLLRLASPLLLSRSQRWDTALSLFLIPPLTLMMTAIAIVIMGPHGNMVMPWEGWLSYGLAWGFLGLVVVQWGVLGGQAYRTRLSLQQYPQQTLLQTPTRIIDTPAAFSAQVGVWNPQLVISRGLLESLNAEHLKAVLAHEAAHIHYRDTFWGFWLGGLRRLTLWLPHTEMLWQELLLLREIRADRRAIRTVDNLVLAEALVQVISAPMVVNEAIGANFSCARPSRLARRIDALLQPDLVAQPCFESHFWQLSEVCLSLTPLLTVPFHH